MEHGVGYFIELPGEPTVYLAGDTLLTEAVRGCITGRKPDIAVVPAGGARFDAGGEILMDGRDALELARLTGGHVLANHLEALDHCPTTREELRGAARQAGLAHKLLVPADGERSLWPRAA
jgi:L-ascorbate metabolism protein UlaG (beta-lactamase superfamily)